MNRLFPERYALKGLGGARASQFAKREDAFQQLVGDALKMAAGYRVSIAPTKGQDGSIDAFLEPGGELGGPFQDLPAPLIVECKDHDDTIAHVADNVFKGWADVQKKLRKQARNAWPNLFGPWKRAAAYAYCVSAFLPDQRTRENLQRRIQHFFEKLPKSQRPPITHVRVIGWHELRQWLNQMPRVCDDWLGVGIPAIVDHETHLARLLEFHEYLRSSKLRFIPPSGDAASHPKQVLSRLTMPDGKPGVLLVGPGGVGKTRTSLEAASLAAAEGWRVLHLQPGPPTVTAEDVAEAILSKPCRTLLVFDYLDQMDNPDLGVMRRRVLPEATARGSVVALLANSRPGWMKIAHAERDELFCPIPIHTTPEHGRRIVQHIAATVAPTASLLVGSAEVVRLCGQRPSIALIVAREVESRARNGILEHLDLECFRSADLNAWLRQRLAEPPLKIAPPDELLGRPSVPVVAVASALASTPRSRAIVTSAAASALAALGWNSPEDADRLTALLLELGWLVSDETLLTTAHDVVVDEVLDQVIRDGTSIRTRELEAILSVCLKAPASLGRFAIAFRRVLGAIQQSEAADRLQAALDSWLRENLATLGQSLPRADPDLSGYALGALLGGPPWDDLVVESWDTLVGPWLSEHGDKEEARHLLHTGLRRAEPKHAPILLDSAVTWLAQNGHLLTASFILGPMLHRTDLAERTSLALKYTCGWLHKHGVTQEAQFVLKPLLVRTDLGELLPVALNRAFVWLNKHGDTLKAQFVLKPLLGRTDLGDRTVGALDCAFRWLNECGDTLEAPFVLSPLLARSDLGKLALDALDRAFAWLGKHGSTSIAQFVLAPLLGRTDLGERTADALESCNAWLAKHGNTVEAQFLLNPLLATKGPIENDESVLNLGEKWLALHKTDPRSEFVFNRILRKRHLPDARWANSAAIAVAWLDQTPSDHSNRDHALYSLLARPELLSPDQRERLARHALDWLREHINDKSTERMPAALRKLLRVLPRNSPSFQEIKSLWNITRDREDLQLGGFRSLVKRLNEAAATNGEEVSAELVRAGCAGIRAQIQLSPGSAAYAIAPLLALACRMGNESLRETKILARCVLHDERLSIHNIAGISKGCRRLLGAGAFPSADEAMKLFHELGL